MSKQQTSSVESPLGTIIQECVTQFYADLPPGEVAAGLSVGAINGTYLNGDPIMATNFSGYANRDELPIAEDTVFEIGSVTKVFTTTMLAAAVNDGDFDLDSPAQDYLGGVVELPVHNPGANPVQMTVLDLADYTSGIPDKSPTNTGSPN